MFEMCIIPKFFNGNTNREFEKVDTLNGDQANVKNLGQSLVTGLIDFRPKVV